MKIQPINSIECALLHSRYSQLASSRLLESLETIIGKLGLLGAAELSSTEGEKSLFNVGDYCVTVLQDTTPLAPEGFGGCLPQPITKIMMPDAENRIAAHTAHTFISVTRSPAVAAADIVDDEEPYGFGDFRTSKDAHLAMKLAYWLADAVHLNNPASAIHWLPSDHLVPPQFFELAGQGASLTPLLIRPYLYSSAGSIGAGNPVGVVANGSQYLMDRPVIFEEAAVDYEWVIQRSSQFIDSVITAQAIPDNGTAFVPVEGEVIEVLHRGPEPSNPLGSYLLIPRNVPKFGIKGGLNSVFSAENREEASQEHAQGKLDENDPIDQAILQALKERAAEMRQPTKLPEVKDRRMSPHETHAVASFGRRATFGKR